MLKNSTKERKAYVVARSTHDYSALYEHVDRIIYITSGMRSQFKTSTLYREILTALQDSTPDDYLVPTGLGVAQMLAAAIFAIKHGRVNFLLFKDGRYVKREVILTKE